MAFGDWATSGLHQVSRVGWGFDAHRFGGSGPLKLCAIDIDSGRSLAGTSDADVALHAVMDALLGAAALGDIGEHFASSDPRWANTDSGDLARTVVAMIKRASFSVVSVDITIISESVRVAPHRSAMRQALSALLGVDLTAVSVKATSTDGLGFTGRDEGVAAMAVATLDPDDQA